MAITNAKVSVELYAYSHRNTRLRLSMDYYNQ